ncbi:hypothetical protein EON83_24680 [bacterium]|nr:MAG: hypothetical protein EON83_24680 [bacterium]
MNVLKTLSMKAIRTMRRVSVNPRSVAVFVPESVGSVGDQAMVEVVREQLCARRLLPTFVYMPGWLEISLRSPTRTEFLKTPSNFSPTFWKLILESNAVLTIGADVADGVYGNTLPLRWLGKLVRAHQAGCKAGLINFSFSNEADHHVSHRISTASGVVFTPRDPISFERFKSATRREGILTADLAFLLKPELCSDHAFKINAWLEERKSEGDLILFANLSGHTLSRMHGDGIRAMECALRRWLSASTKRSILLVPHDFRPAPFGDVEALEQLRSMLDNDFPDRVRMLRPPFTAWDVKALCAHADLAISGRMHLAIACLGMGVPVVSVVYVGKFEGLMQHARLDEEGLLISTHEALDSGYLHSKLEMLTAEREGLRAKIISRLDAIRRLSEKNLAWI